MVWNIFIFPYWECHNPNWRTPSFFRGVAQLPTRYGIYWWVSLWCNIWYNIWLSYFSEGSSGFSGFPNGGMTIPHHWHLASMPGSFGLKHRYWDPETLVKFIGFRYEGFHSHGGTPIAGWMMNRGTCSTPILRNLHMNCRYYPAWLWKTWQWTVLICRTFIRPIFWQYVFYTCRFGMQGTTRAGIILQYLESTQYLRMSHSQNCFNAKSTGRPYMLRFCHHAKPC